MTTVVKRRIQAEERRVLTGTSYAQTASTADFWDQLGHHVHYAENV